MVSSLTHTLGFENLQLAEDAVQDALLKAMRNWPFAGIPQSPSAWLIQVARNYALDLVRRVQNFRAKENEIASQLESRADSRLQSNQTYFDDEIRDDPPPQRPSKQFPKNACWKITTFFMRWWRGFISN
jgi:predicted RNA polymerase sigma factor